MKMLTQQPKCLQDIAGDKKKLKWGDILQLTILLLKQGNKSDDLRKNLNEALAQDAPPVNILLCLYTAITNHNADSKTRNAAIKSLFNSDYNHDLNNEKYIVDKQIFLKEVATILEDKDLIRQNEAVKKEIETKRTEEAKNKEETQKAKDAINQARKAAAEAKQARNAARQKAEEARQKEAARQKAARQKEAAEEQARKEGVDPLQGIFDFFLGFLPPIEKQKDNPPKHETPPYYVVPSLFEIEKYYKENPVQPRFQEERKEKINAANKPMTFIKKGLQDIYKVITNLFSPEKEAESKASNTRKCTRNPTERPQDRQDFRKTLRNGNGNDRTAQHNPRINIPRRQTRRFEGERNARAHIR